MDVPTLHATSLSDDEQQEKLSALVKVFAQNGIGVLEAHPHQSSSIWESPGESKISRKGSTILISLDQFAYWDQVERKKLGTAGQVKRKKLGTVGQWSD